MNLRVSVWVGVHLWVHLEKLLSAYLFSECDRMAGAMRKRKRVKFFNRKLLRSCSLVLLSLVFFVLLLYLLPSPVKTTFGRLLFLMDV